MKKEWKNKEISAALQEIAFLLELKGENPFKIKAYANAAKSIETLEEEIESLRDSLKEYDPDYRSSYEPAPDPNPEVEALKEELSRGKNVD